MVWGGALGGRAARHAAGAYAAAGGGGVRREGVAGLFARARMPAGLLARCGGVQDGPARAGVGAGGLVFAGVEGFCLRVSRLCAVARKCRWGFSYGFGKVLCIPQWCQFCDLRFYWRPIGRYLAKTEMRMKNPIDTFCGVHRFRYCGRFRGDGDGGRGADVDERRMLLFERVVPIGAVESERPFALHPSVRTTSVALVWQCALYRPAERVRAGRTVSVASACDRAPQGRVRLEIEEAD